MKSIFSLVTFIMFSVAGYAEGVFGTSYETAFAELEKTIAQQQHYLDLKLQQIDQMREKLNVAEDAAVKFDYSRKLYEKYFDLKIDSAFQYAERMLHLSEAALKNDPKYKQEALLCIARAYCYSGMYKECEDLLHTQIARAEKLNQRLRAFYFLIQLELSKGMSDHTIVKREIERYHTQIEMCLDSLMVYLPPDAIRHTIYTSNRLRANDDYDKAFAVLIKAYNKLTTEDRDMAHVAFYLADLSHLRNDPENEKLFLALSATSDFKNGVKEYVSLWKLAIILYNEGDIETAHRFIEISLKDAQYSGAYRWLQHIIKVLPKIYEAYNAKVIQQRNEILMGFFVILCLMAGIFWQYRKLRRAKLKLSQTNFELIALNSELNAMSDNLNLSNADLHLANSQLVYLNNELVSTSLLKETYLSKFIDLCSDYIDKLDDHRGDLKRLLKRGKIEQIRTELESTAYIENEYKLFLTNFDETFLKLYPNFVIEFNMLFPEEDRLELKNNELLTTELRIYALIRLGIVDSNKIARFLRCSISTIYTYRSKIKNKSLCPEFFEDKIKGLQRVKYLSTSAEHAS